MSGTLDGGRKARDTNKERHGADFYKKIGAKGGANNGTGGFYYAKHVLKDDKFIRESGKLGGQISRRRKIMKEDDMGALKDKQLKEQEDGVIDGELEV